MVEIVKITLGDRPEVSFSDGNKMRLEAVTHDSPMAGSLSGRDGILIGEQRGWHAATRLLNRKDEELNRLRRYPYPYTDAKSAALHHYQLQLAALDVDSDGRGE